MEKPQLYRVSSAKTDETTTPATTPIEESGFRVGRYRNSRFWGVWEAETLVCVCSYRKGAREVVRRLSLAQTVDSKGTRQ